MNYKKLKKTFWKEWRKALWGKFPYIILGYIIYPFIKRTQTREKYHSGKGGWWNRQLWYMINDDELEAHGVDWDPGLVAEQGIDTSTAWGRFKASYWFNARRNPAYNYSLTHTPINPNGSYEVVEREIDELYLNYEKINPLLWAEWKWINKQGELSNKGDILSYEKSKVGKGKAWFHPNHRTDLLYCRWSWAKRKTFWKWDFYYSVRLGAWSDKYDIQIKCKRVRR